MTAWWIVGAVVTLVLLYFVVKFAVVSALRTVADERDARDAQRERLRAREADREA